MARSDLMLGSDRRRQYFQKGDRVRDYANLGGVVVETFGNGVKVHWNNGETNWIDELFLYRATTPPGTGEQ